MKRESTLPALAILFANLTVPVPVLGHSFDSWQGQETSHFAILATSQEPGTHEILVRLETARVFFERTGLGKESPQLSILALDSASQADVYRVNRAAYAFYQRTREGDFVVMRDLRPEHFPVAVHEYTHFVLEHAGFHLPLWLNEGLAEFYSTLAAHDGGQVVIGEAPAGREDTLATQRWMDMSTLVAVNHDSPYYQQQEKMLLFYAQSWATVHMLVLDPQYEAGLHKIPADGFQPAPQRRGLCIRLPQRSQSG